MLRLRVFSAIERLDLVDFAKRSAVGSDAKKHTGSGEFAASAAIQAFATASFVDGKHGADRPLNFGIPIVFVEGGHEEGF